MAGSASAVGLMFVGNPNVIVGSDPLMVELLVGPVSGGVLFCSCILVPVGGVLLGVLFITMHVPSTESRLDVSSCVSREEIDRALDCVCEEWDEGVVNWEQLVACIILA